MAKIFRSSGYLVEATGIDIYCNACGRKIKIVDDKKVGESE